MNDKTKIISILLFCCGLVLSGYVACYAEVEPLVLPDDGPLDSQENLDLMNDAFERSNGAADAYTWDASGYNDYGYDPYVLDDYELAEFSDYPLDDTYDNLDFFGGDPYAVPLEIDTYDWYDSGYVGYDSPDELWDGEGVIGDANDKDIDHERVNVGEKILLHEGATDAHIDTYNSMIYGAETDSPLEAVNGVRNAVEYGALPAFEEDLDTHYLRLKIIDGNIDAFQQSDPTNWEEKASEYLLENQSWSYDYRNIIDDKINDEAQRIEEVAQADHLASVNVGEKILLHEGATDAHIDTYNSMIYGAETDSPLEAVNGVRNAVEYGALPAFEEDLDTHYLRLKIIDGNIDAFQQSDPTNWEEKASEYLLENQSWSTDYRNIIGDRIKELSDRY